MSHISSQLKTGCPDLTFHLLNDTLHLKLKKINNMSFSGGSVKKRRNAIDLDMKMKICINPVTRFMWIKLGFVGRKDFGERNLSRLLLIY